MNVYTRHRPVACRRRPGRRDTGQVTAFVVVMTAALLLAVGLVCDGGAALGARLHAADLAQEAARAGAQEIDLAAYRGTGQLRLDPARAQTAARDYLTRAGWAGAVTVHAAGATVTVTLRGAQPTRLLRLAGLTSLAVTGTGTATAQRGISRPDTAQAGTGPR
jgi:hypothetical protein